MRMQNLTVRKPLGQAGSESSRSPPTGKRDPYLSCLEFMGGNAVKVNDFWLYEDSLKISTASLSTDTDKLSLELMAKVGKESYPCT